MAIGEQAADIARQWLGTPYRHQASTVGAGCDCLGLLRGVWRALYGAEPQSLPPYRADWRDASVGNALQTAAEQHMLRCMYPAAIGQVALFKLHRALPPRHCGILIAPDRMIHAQEKEGVIEVALSPSWLRRIAGRYDFPERI